MGPPSKTAQQCFLVLEVIFEQRHIKGHHLFVLCA